MLPVATPETTAHATPAPASQGDVSTPGGIATAAPTISATATVALSVTATTTPAAAGATTTTPTRAPAATATAPATATPPSTATATATPSPSPSSTPLPTATAVPPPPSQWSTYACAPYSITPTPSVTATPAIKLTPPALLQPTASATANSRPKPAATRQPSARQPQRHMRKKTVKKAGPPPPLIGAHGSALRKAVHLDLELRHDAHGRLSGWLRYTDTHKGKRLDLREAGWRTASTSCGALQSALVVGRLRDKKKVYDATLTLGVDKRHAARFALHLGRSYSLSAALTGSAIITCLPKPSPHKPSYKAPARKPTHKTPRRATTKTNHAATSHKPSSPKVQGQGQGHQAPPKGRSAPQESSRG